MENKSAHPAPAEACNLDAGHVRRSLIHMCAVHVRLMGIKAPDTKASTDLHTNKQESADAAYTLLESAGCLLISGKRL